jgi:DNA-binding transcriptional MerR regulator
MAKKEEKFENLPDMLTLQQASEVLNVHPNTLRNWDNLGVLKAVRYGKRGDRRYHKEDIVGLLNKNKSL